MTFEFSLSSSFIEFFSSFCLALLTDARLLSLVSISSLSALETVSFNSLFFGFNLDFLSLFSASPFNLLVALCSANLRLSKSLTAGEFLVVKLGFSDAPLLKVDDGLKPEGFLKPFVL